MTGISSISNMIGARIASATAVVQTPFGSVFAVVRTEDNRIF